MASDDVRLLPQFELLATVQRETKLIDFALSRSDLPQLDRIRLEFKRQVAQRTRRTFDVFRRGTMENCISFVHPVSGERVLTTRAQLAMTDWLHRSGALQLILQHKWDIWIEMRQRDADDASERAASFMAMCMTGDVEGLKVYLRRKWFLRRLDEEETLLRGFHASCGTDRLFGVAALLASTAKSWRHAFAEDLFRWACANAHGNIAQLMHRELGCVDDVGLQDYRWHVFLRAAWVSAVVRSQHRAFLRARK
jgi:hypothetical protein